MDVITKSVKSLDAPQLQVLVDEGWTQISTKFVEGLAEIISISGASVVVQYPTVAYATPIRIDAISAVHKPIADDPQTITIDLPADHWIPAAAVEKMMEKMNKEGL